MTFDYDALNVLAAVVRSGSFEAAAKSMNVTQSAVSQRIKQLEERFGAILVLRGRPCVATDEALALVRHVEEVGLMEFELRRQLGLDGGPQSASANVRISVNTDSLATWFPVVVDRASKELNLRLELIPEDQEFTEERLRSGDALAIVTSKNTTIAGCQIVSLGSMEYMAVASPQFVETHFPGEVTLESVAAAPSIRFDQKDTLPAQWLEVAFGRAEKLSPHQMPSYEGHLQCCLQSIGWAMMPALTVGQFVERGDLVEVRPGTSLSLPLYWQCRSNAVGALARLNETVVEVASKSLTSD